jgi:hypothetical protein
MEIDPISKEVIDNRFLITMQGFSFDINNIYDWFKYSENWINPVTNIRFSNGDIVRYLEKIIELGKIPDILNDHRFCSDCQYSNYNYSKYLNYYQYLSFVREYEKNVEKYKNLNDRYIKINKELAKIEEILKSYTSKINKILKDKKVEECISKNQINEIMNFSREKIDVSDLISENNSVAINKKLNNLVILHQKAYKRSISYKKKKLKLEELESQIEYQKSLI